MQSSATVVTATANATSTAAADWGNVMSTLLSGNWSKLEPAALQNFGMLGMASLTMPLKPAEHLPHSIHAIYQAQFQHWGPNHAALLSDLPSSCQLALCCNYIVALQLVTTMLPTPSGVADVSERCLTTDWSQLGNFEMTTPLADLLQEISDKGIPTSVDDVSPLSAHPA